MERRRWKKTERQIFEANCADKREGNKHKSETCNGFGGKYNCMKFGFAQLVGTKRNSKLEEGQIRRGSDCRIEGTQFRDCCKGAHNEGCKKRYAQESEHVGEILQGHGEMGVSHGLVRIRPRNRFRKSTKGIGRNQNVEVKLKSVKCTRTNHRNVVIYWIHHCIYRSEEQLQNDHKFITPNEKIWCPVHLKIR